MVENMLVTMSRMPTSPSPWSELPVGSLSSEERSTPAL